MVFTEGSAAALGIGFGVAGHVTLALGLRWARAWILSALWKREWLGKSIDRDFDDLKPWSGMKEAYPWATDLPKGV